MSDVLSRILAGALGGGMQGGQQGGDMGGGMGGGSPLGDPRLRRGESPGYDDRGAIPQGRMPQGMPQSGGGGLADILGGMLGGGAMGGGGAAGGGLGGVLGGLLGGMMGGGAAPAPQRRGGMPQGGGGGLGDLLGGMGGMKGMALMALLAYMMRGQGGRAGLSSLTDQLRGAGLGDTVDSWVGPGANRDLDPQALMRAIPPDALAALEAQTGVGRDELLSDLSRGLPRMVDRLTPQGRMPERDDELDDIDEKEVLGSFGMGGVSGAAYGKFGPGQGGGMKS